MSRLAELKQERDWRKCQYRKGDTVEQQLEAFAFFCEHYWQIRVPGRGRIFLKLRAAQLETVRDWMAHRYTICLKARQIGFSTLAGAYAFWISFFGEGDHLTIMLSKSERESIKLLQHSKRGYKYLPEWMKKRGPVLLTEHLQKMVFSNDAAIESLPSQNDPARGESVDLVIVDEWAFLPNPEEAWASIEPVADVGGRVIGISTAKGAGTFFHQLWVGAETGTNNFKPIFHPWWAGGDRDADWYESKRRSMQEWQLHQEYPSNAEEAFIRSGNPVFSIDKLLQLERIARSPEHAPLRGRLATEGKGLSTFVEDGGHLHIWRKPQDLAERFVMGADVAEGLEHGDYSAAHVISVRTGEVVAAWHGHIDPDLFGAILCEIGYFFNGALLGVESNNHGLTTLKAIQRYGYRNIYRQRSQVRRASKPTEQLGWRTTVTTKPLMIDELAMAIREDSLDLLCSHTIAELKTYIRLPDGKTQGSPFDDRVMSLALANQMLKHAFDKKWEDQQDDYMTMAWWAKQLMRDSRPEHEPIGAHNVRARA